MRGRWSGPTQVGCLYSVNRGFVFTFDMHNPRDLVGLQADLAEDDFDMGTFAAQVAMFGIPLCVSIAAAVMVLRASRWRIALLQCVAYRWLVAALRRLPWLRCCAERPRPHRPQAGASAAPSSAATELGTSIAAAGDVLDAATIHDYSQREMVPKPSAVWWFAQALRFTLMLPCFVLSGWAAHAAEKLSPRLVGVGIGTVWNCALVCGVAFGLWRGQRWRLSSHRPGKLSGVQILGIVALALFVAFEVTATLTYKTFTGFSWLFLGLNMIPMVFIAYWNAAHYGAAILTLDVRNSGGL